MKKFHTLLLAALTMLAPALPAPAATKLTLGTYNIRFRTLSDKTDDPATNKYWDARCDQVALTIKNGGYDVIALNELTDDARTDGRTMMQDMKRNFPAPEWGWISEDNIPWSHDASTVHSIIYKPGVLEELDHGKFYHSPDPDGEYKSDVWDMGNKGRMALWAKFRVKATGEIFYFTETHLHHTGNMAKNEGSRINVDKMRSIAGPYPVFICGDHNCQPSRKPFYDIYRAYFEDSREVAETRDDSDGTCNVWTNADQPSKWGRLDYVWVRRARVLTYEALTEKYGLPFYPSDHLPLRVTVELEAPAEVTSRYVDIKAAEGGDGSAAAPFNNLQQAIDVSVDGDTILMAAGTYRPTWKPEGKSDRDATFKVNASLTFIGGYNRDFSEVDGRSVLSGDLDGDEAPSDADVYNVMTIGTRSAVELKNLEVCYGKGKSHNGAGICCNGPRLVLDNVYVHDNYTKGLGAGVYAYGQIVARKSRFERNESNGTGGAVYSDYSNSTMWWYHEFADCYFADNRAMAGSAIFNRGSMWFTSINCTYAGNTATARGTVVLGGTVLDTRATFYNNTFVSNRVEATASGNNNSKGGSAIYVLDMKELSVDHSTGALIALTSNTIIGNECVCLADGVAPADFYGAAVQAAGVSALKLTNNIIAGNYSSSPTADVYVNSQNRLEHFYNVFSSAESINFKLDTNDESASSPAEMISWLAVSHDSSMENGRLVPRLTDNGGYVPTVRLCEPTLGSIALNSLRAVRFREDYAEADLNADRQIHKENSNDTDQRGQPRNNKGKACFGAYEYDGVNGIATVAGSPADAPAVALTSEGLVIDAPAPMQASLFTVSGTAVATLSDIPAGRSVHSVAALDPGVYLLAWRGGAAKILIR